VISAQSVLQASDLVGRAAAREGVEADAIDGVIPDVVVDPDSPEALATLLSWASNARVSLVLRGSGTKIGWGRRPASLDLIVGTRRLNHVLSHQHGDLTASVEAGVTIGDLNRELAKHGQWLPVDVSFDEATVGGVIAANDSGPLRQRHGTPRDLLIGVRLATTDGRLVKAGGNVVKNVAGYDLGRLMSGSFGSLAAIVAATFKLAPLPTALATMAAAFRTPDGLSRAVAAVSTSQLEPTAFDVRAVVPTATSRPDGTGAGRNADYQLLVRFASTAEAVEAQIEGARGLVNADRIDISRGADESHAWRGHRDLIWAAPGAVVKFSWLPAELPSVLDAVAAIWRTGVGIGFTGRAGVGVGAIRIDGDAAAQVAAIASLRRTHAIGNVVVLRAGPEVKERVDIWSLPSGTEGLFRALKQALDPAGVLTAGRGPI
jgi:glycolate oxidase FAD binding subunit